MKKKMIAVAAGVMAFCILGTGCQIHQSFSNLVPEEYGAWDNYYIYHGNVRSKTTGDDAELLVSSIEWEGENCTVASCADSAIVGDDVYLCLSFEISETGGKLQDNALVKYNVKTKTKDTLMVNYTAQPEEGVTYVYRVYSIESASEDGLILYGQKEILTVDENGEQHTGYNSAYFKVTPNGEFVEEVTCNNYGYTKVDDDYYVKSVSLSESTLQTVLYMTWGMEEGVPMCTYDNADYYMETEFVEKNGVEGFLMKTYALESGSPETYYGDKLQKVEFFDVSVNETTTLYEGNTYAEWVEIPESEYFITYDVETVKYTWREGYFDSATEATATLKKNCVLQRIVYTAEGVRTEVAYTFEKGLGLKSAAGVAASLLYIDFEWYESAAGCKNGGYQTQAYQVNISSDGEKMKKMDSDDWRNAKDICYGVYMIENGVSCGQYTYYIERTKLTTVLNSTSYAYSLNRYNIESGETEVMQLWSSSSSQEGEKYCALMWRNNGSALDEFIVRNY